MGCLFTVLLFASTRAAIVFWWILDPDRWQSAFSKGWIPVLGFFLLPATTLMYVIVAPKGNVSSYDFLWLGLAFLGDMTSLFHHFQSGRRQRAMTV